MNANVATAVSRVLPGAVICVKTIGIDKPVELSEATVFA
jgi:hypothetical protein